MSSTESKAIASFLSDQYECHLSDEMLKKAADELREDPLLREQGIERLRHYIEKQPYIIKCRMDSQFLLRFLRVNKFSIIAAQQSLDKYLYIRNKVPSLLKNLDPELSLSALIVDSGIAFPLLEKDKKGHTIIYCRQFLLDEKILTAEDEIKVFNAMLEIFLSDEEIQITGIVFLVNLLGMTLQQSTLWGLQSIRNFVNCIQKALPVRMKGIFFNEPPSYVVPLIELYKNLSSSKIVSRIHVGKFSEFQDDISLDILPKEDGGLVPMQVMIDAWKDKLRKNRKTLLALDEALVSDDSLRPHNEEDPYNLGGIQGSFRPLEID